MFRLLRALPTNTSTLEVALWDAIENKRTETALRLIDAIHAYGDESGSSLSKQLEKESFLIKALVKNEYKVALSLLELQKQQLINSEFAFSKILKLIIESNDENLFSSFLLLMNDHGQIGYRCNVLISTDELGRNIFHIIANSNCRHNFLRCVLKQLTPEDIAYLINQQDIDGNTALHSALHVFHLSPKQAGLVDAFLENGARLDIPNDKTETPFTLLCKNIENDRAIINNLRLSYGAALNLAEYYQDYLRSAPHANKIKFDPQKMFLRGHTNSLLMSAAIKINLFAPTISNDVLMLESNIYKQNIAPLFSERKKLNVLIDLVDKWCNSFDSQRKTSNCIKYNAFRLITPTFIFLAGSYLSYSIYIAQIDPSPSYRSTYEKMKKEQELLTNILTFILAITVTVAISTATFFFPPHHSCHSRPPLLYYANSWQSLIIAVENWIKEHSQNKSNHAAIQLDDLTDLINKLKVQQDKVSAIKLFGDLKTVLTMIKLHLGETMQPLSKDFFLEQTESFNQIEYLGQQPAKDLFLKQTEVFGRIRY